MKIYSWQWKEQGSQAFDSQFNQVNFSHNCELELEFISFYISLKPFVGHKQKKKINEKVSRVCNRHLSSTFVIHNYPLGVLRDENPLLTSHAPNTLCFSPFSFHFLAKISVVRKIGLKKNRKDIFVPQCINRAIVEMQRYPSQ